MIAPEDRAHLTRRLKVTTALYGWATSPPATVQNAQITNSLLLRDLDVHIPSGSSHFKGSQKTCDSSDGPFHSPRFDCRDRPGSRGSSLSATDPDSGTLPSLTKIREEVRRVTHRYSKCASSFADVGGLHHWDSWSFARGDSASACFAMSEAFCLGEVD